MKKAFIAAMVAFTLTTQAVAPRPANAAAGVVLTAAGGAGIPLLVTGGIITAAGVTVMAISEHTNDYLWFFFGTVAAFVGILLLDEDTQTLAPIYHRLSPGDGLKMGLSEEELSAYNAELEEINATFQTMASELATMKKPGIEDSRALWKKASAYFLPETQRALDKVSLHYHGALYEKMTRADASAVK